MTKVKNYLLNYDNMYIIQDTDMFNFSLDSVLLPNFVTINKKTKKILDIGSGNAPIPLILSTLTDAQIMAVEIQKDVYELGKESIKINKLENRIDFINADINELYKEIDTETFDVITCNPPYFKVNESSNLNDSEYKTIARHEIKLDLEKLFKIAKKLLKDKGNIDIVHRPERLSDIVSEMKKNNIEPKRIQFVYPSINSEANILLIEGTKNGNPGVKILPPLISHKQNGEYTEQVKQFFEKR